MRMKEPWRESPCTEQVRVSLEEESETEEEDMDIDEELQFNRDDNYIRKPNQLIYNINYKLYLF